MTLNYWLNNSGSERYFVQQLNTPKESTKPNAPAILVEPAAVIAAFPIAFKIVMI